MSVDINTRDDVGGALQVAVFGRLTEAGANPPVPTGVYDRVPAGAAFPFVTIPDAQVIEDGAEGIVGDEVFLDLHVWSRAIGSMEAKAVAGWLRRRLDQAPLDLGARHALVDIAFTGQRDAGSDDPLTTHLVVSFRALTETV